MGLTAVQGALARLYTDAPFRERFFADPPGAARELGLSDEDAAQVARSSAAQVGFFAASLIAKRRQEAEKLLPLTRRLLGPRFAACFEHYAAAPLPDGLQKHRADALAFAAFLEECDLSWDPVWAMDVLRYETAWLEAASPRRRVLFRFFRYPVGRIVREAEEDSSVTLPKRTTFGIWFRLGRNGTLHHLLLPLAR